jgi:hypothetical protein
MTTLARCIVQEEGWLSLVSFVLIDFLIIAVAGTLLVFGLLLLLRRSQQRADTMEIDVKKQRGVFPAPYILVASGLVLFAALIAIPGYFYGTYATKYLAYIDTGQTNASLDAVKATLNRDTRSPIVLADNVKDFKITGPFHGMCVSDLLESICAQYSSKLHCNISWLYGTKIEAPSGP